ncbi:MAG: hypothetical protein M1823_003447 [Watsoniomyces obsoletus]|nr:MAG: hypothetical protein M1823_003447 [Watsoniomyces obsoletus]
MYAARFCQVQRLPLLPGSAMGRATERPIPRQYIVRISQRFNSTIPSRGPSGDISKLLTSPSWSVRTLLPESSRSSNTSPSVSSKQLHHLFRLSALPPPKTPEEEAKIMQTLSSQLHFVQEIQSVDTTNIEPLRSIRDETPEAAKENEISMTTLQESFDKEEIRGWSRRIRRKKEISKVDTQGAEDWDVLGQASRKIGRYFVVEKTEK